VPLWRRNQVLVIILTPGGTTKYWHWWDHNPHSHYISITETGSETIGSHDSYSVTYRETLMEICTLAKL